MTMNYDKINRFIVKSIDFEGYDIGGKAKTKQQKLETLYTIFMSEYGWQRKRLGGFKALSEWLAGLPTCLNIPFCNCDILKLAEKTGGLKKNASEA